MDGFASVLVEFLLELGVKPEEIFSDCPVHKTGLLDLPGYYRPTKEWDFPVVRNGILMAAIELKTQVGSSFGNNFNNRTEEAMGSALDLWTAYRERVLGYQSQPWLGYLLLLEDSVKSQSRVRLKPSNFQILPEFHGASYRERYEIFCRKLVLERLYNAACFITSQRSGQDGEGNYAEPADDLTARLFLSSLARHVAPEG